MPETLMQAGTASAPLLGSPKAGQGGGPPRSVPGEAFWFTAFDGKRLRGAIYRAQSPAGSVVLSPGRTEVIEKYGEVVEDLLQRNFTVLVHDWRGQGLSDRLLPKDPLRGHAGHWRGFVDDYAGLLDVYPSDLVHPRVALGHSMGGTLTALAVAEGIGEFDGLALSAPMFGINIGGIPVWAARLLARTQVLAGRGAALARRPYDPLNDKFLGNPLTHDEVRWRRNRDLLRAYPELALAGPTWGWLDFALSAAAALERRAGELAKRAVPTCIRYAGEERLIDNAATRRIAKRCGIDDCRAIEGAKHEILMEEDDKRRQFWKAFDGLAAAATGRWVSRHDRGVRPAAPPRPNATEPGPPD